MSQKTGRAFINVAGDQLESEPNAKMSMGTPDREAVMGSQGVIGYKEKDTVPFIECTILHDAKTSLKELADMTNVTASFRTDTGTSFVLRNAWLAKSPELSDGKVSLRFEGISMEEVT